MNKAIEKEQIWNTGTVVELPYPFQIIKKILNDSAAVREFQDIRLDLAGCTAQVTDALKEQSNQAWKQETNNTVTRSLVDR